MKSIVERFIIWTSLSIVSVSTLANGMQIVCDHPADYLQGNSELQRIHAAFDGKIERRIFSEVHYYPRDPHLTIGMGHFTYGNIFSLFEKIKGDSNAWDLMLETWESSLTPSMWVQFNTDTKTKGNTKSALEEGLTSLLCVNKTSSSCKKEFKDWTDKQSINFNEDNNWFRSGWKKSSRIPAIAQIQANHWLDTIILPSQTAAIGAGASTLGGIAVFSSGKSSANAISDSMEKTVAKIAIVPPDAVPRNFDIDPKRALEDWKSVMAWAEYIKIKKGEIRPRMREIWRVYFESSWGRMPLYATDIQHLKHTGCYMARGTFEVSALFKSNENLVCHDIPPLATVASCTK